MHILNRIEIEFKITLTQRNNSPITDAFPEIRKLIVEAFGGDWWISFVQRQTTMQAPCAIGNP